MDKRRSALTFKSRVGNFLGKKKGARPRKVKGGQFDRLPSEPVDGEDHGISSENVVEDNHGMSSGPYIDGKRSHCGNNEEDGCQYLMENNATVVGR